MDTRIRGYDSSVVMRDLMESKRPLRHSRLDRESILVKLYPRSKSGDDKIWGPCA